ncbi:Nonribosomal peptide synthetase 3 [Lasiodiplodia theobromae]|uniref:Nonribosomal peptide synthetase 3 n=1 Tax=Lasiodiplodia theobromae TaxID=45133 RepID=A0A5N5D785_9PEZI|nr:Nonribosomal peptide synthetase 3 [Lasiodiplodia theobromae]
MALFYHRAVDLLSDDPFDHVEVVQWPSPAQYEHAAPTEIDDDILATAAQTQIVSKEKAQWCRVRIILPTNPPPTIERIESTWRQISYHHSCLRTVLRTDPKTGKVYHRVLRRISDIKWKGRRSSASTTSSSQVSDISDDDLAHLTVEEAPGAGYHVYLHVRRALVDSTSLGVIKVNFDLLYCGVPVPESTPFRAYARYIAQTKDVEASHKFWADALENASTSNAVRPVEAVDGSLEFAQRSAISAELNESMLYNISVVELEYGIPRRVLFETLWAIVLQHHTGSDEVIFGSVGRDMGFFGADSCIGCLDQTYPIRLSISGDVKFQELANAVSSYHRTASQHSYIGYHEIQRHIHGNAVETVVNYTPSLNSPSTAGQLTCFPLALSINGTRPLKLTLCHTPSIVAGEAELLLSHFIVSLRSALQKFYLPHSLVGNIEIDSDEERTAIVKGNRSTKEEHPSTIPRLFEETAAERADTIALEDEHHNKLTFAELNKLANKVARHLQLGKGDIIPVCMDRSIELIVSLFAILKSGAAYTILDPEGPKERNLQIVEDSKARIVLTQRKYAILFENSREIENSLEAARDADKPIDDSDLNLDIRTHDKCYIVYTSGSAGKPKGVVLTHGAATNGMAYHKLNDKTRWLLFYNPTFSAAQRTMLSTLVHGGTLLIVNKKTLETSLVATLNDLRVEALGITPSALTLLHPSDVPHLKQITLVGERIPQTLVSQWADHVELRNTYGLSECTQLNFGTRLHASSNPRVIGRPADTTSAYVLKPGSTDLAPRGVIGEMCLAGPQLGSGYLNEFERTARAFIDNPFGKGKLYRTGDSAKMLHDGQFEIFGRIDFQAKINGQKVQPAEVDRVLIRHDAVEASITTAAEIAGRTVLVAGLVLEGGVEWKSAVQDVRAHAEQYLPGYMVPSFWMPLDDIPTNINGKTDVRGFRAKAESLGVEGFLKLMAGGAAEALTDKTQIQIAEVWAEVLGLDIKTIGKEHSFLLLGGSSIQAIRALAELRKIGFETDMASLLSETSLEEAASTYIRLAADADADPEPFELIKDVKLRESFKLQPAVLDAYPATPLQQDLLPSLEMDEDHYSYQRVWDLSNLDLDKLKASFQSVFEKSDILRTSFEPNGRSIIQKVRTDMSLPWVESSLSLDQYLKHDKDNRFKMEGPLFRVGVLSKSILVVTMHHSLFDFWSYTFLYQDVAATYLGKTPAPRPAFSRFVRYLTAQDASVHRRWWRDYLKRAEPTLLNTAPVANITKLSKTLPGTIQDLAHPLGLTAGAVMYAAWAIVLNKHLNSHDVTFMTSLSGRDVPVGGIQTMDGPTLTIVPQRITLDPEQPVSELAKKTSSGLLELARHAQFGMRNGMKAANMKTDSVDTFLNILVKTEDDGTTGSVFKRYGPRPHWGLYWTTMEVEEAPTETAFRIAGLMEERRLQFIMDAFIETVYSIVNNPTQTIAEISILSSSESSFLNNELSNRATLHRPSPSLLHARFEQHAAETPSAIAIDWQGTERVTYAELNGWANQLAHYLIQHGTRVGDRIPLILDKSIDTMVALLGVMKAGAAYVPMSPDNPVERNLFITADVGAKTLVMHRAHAAFNAHHSLPAVFIDDIRSELAALPTTAPAVAIPADSLAYIIYTSGSTGLPKGVQLPHRAAAAAVTSMEVAESRGEGEWRTLQFANYVFDASVQDFFNTLSTRGTLCMAPTESLLSDLAGMINKMAVKQAILTPTVAKLLKPEEVPTFETLIVGGEPLTLDVVESWKGAGRKILNVYGPTETSMVVTTKDVQLGGRIGNIGSPFPTVMAFIVEPDGSGLVPYGAVGELCIAGPQVSDGYVNRSDLTQASFVKNEKLNVDKLYRTGDLARWLPGGEIECLGRKDNQVKIHGHRIELGEVEAAVLKTGVVQNGVVILANVNDKPQLVAFCIFDSTDVVEVQPAADHIDNFASFRENLTGLTPYMIPKIVIPMGEFPKLPSRKVDRKALKRIAEEMDQLAISEYALSGPGEKHKVVKVETEQEAILESIWSDIFKLPTSEIGREASFLSLGGDSISAISLSSMARKAGYILSVTNILRFPDLAAMASKMQVDTVDDSKPKREFIVPEEAKTAVVSAGLNYEQDVEYVYPCPPGQAEFVAQGHREEQMWALMAVRRMPATMSPQTWVDATTKLTEVNDILRTSWLQVSGSEWVGIVLKSSQLDVTITDVADEASATAIIEDFWSTRFTFGKPMIKYAILRYPDQTFDLAIKLNHAVYDGTLLRIFDDHFAAILSNTPLPPYEQFKDFAFHIYQSDKQASLAYWKQTMAGKAHTYPLLPTPTHVPRITAATRLPIPTPLDALAVACGVTPAIIFQAAFQLWLARATANVDISFDYLLSGRNVALSNPQTINGTCANFLPMRLQVDKAADLRSYLQDTQDRFWALTEHGDVGLDEIYGAVGLERKEVGNRTLFLFQPFEPAVQEEATRWLVMAKSKVRMYQPYGLVVEVAKAVGDGHRLTVMYDDAIYTAEAAGKIAEDIAGIVTEFKEAGEDGRRVLEEL